MCPWFNFWFWRYRYILFVCLCCMLPHSFFLHFFLTYLLPYLSFRLTMDLLRFQARCCKRWLNVSFVFLCLFCAVIHFFWLVNACFCVLSLVFYRAMLCIRSTRHGPVSVRPSARLTVCLSVTSRSSTKTAERRITRTTPHDSPGTLVFWSQRSVTGAPNVGGWVKIGDFRHITSYVSKMVQDRRMVLLKSNRKSYALYWMVTLPMTLSAP